MSKNTVDNLSNQLTQHQRELLSSQQNLSHVQNQLYTTQNASGSAENQLNNSLLEQAYLNNQLEVQNKAFNALTCLFDKYRESKGIVLNPSVVLTKVISAEELAHTDVLKEACKSKYAEGFNIGLAKLTNLDFQDSDGKTILMHAIINGFYYGVDKLLQKGANVNLLDNQGANALIYCAQIPHIKYFKQIAEKTTNINLIFKSFEGGNALHTLFLNVNKFVFASELNGELKDHANQYSQLILDEGHNLSPNHIGDVIFSGAFNLNITGEVNPMHNVNRCASYEKAFRLTKFLAEQKNININGQNDEGHTPLFLAAKSLLFDVVDLLFNKYHALDLADKVGYTAWDIAIYNSQQNLIDIFLSKKAINPEAVKLWCAAKKGELNIVEQQINKGTDVNVSIGDICNTTPLLQAILNNNLAIVNFLLRHGANANMPDNNGDFPLHIAAILGFLEIVKSLLDVGADLNAINTVQGIPSLHLAMEQKHTAVVKELINRNADVKIIDKLTDNSSLHWAVHLGDMDVLKSILAKGVNINAKNTGGGTPLYGAVGLNNKIVVEYLLNNGAAPNIPNKVGIYPLHVAANNNLLELITLLAKYADINQKTDDDNHDTPFQFAIQEGKLETIKMLIDCGADLNIAKANTGRPPLYTAIEKQYSEVTKELINKGADVNIKDIGGFVALHLAMVLCDFETAKSILAKTLNINTKNNNGATPLYLAVTHNNILNVKLLVDNNVDANIPDNTGAYPIHIAASNGFSEIISLLAKYCNINQRTEDTNKITPLWVAAQDGKIDIVKILIDNGADLNIVRASNNMSPLCVSMQRQHSEIVKELLARGADVNVKDNQALIALHYAVSLSYDLDITKTILDKTKDINSKDCKGATALYGAIIVNDIDKVNLLLEKEADINIPHNVGLYPWHIASLKGSKEVMQLLKSKMSNIDFKTADSEQYTALWLASQEGHVEIVEYLMDRGANINSIKQSDGTTVLQTAIVNNHLSVIKVLLEKYTTDIDKTNKDGASPLYYSLGYCNQAYKLEVTKFLLEHNANVNTKTIFGDQALHRASNLADIEAVKLLLQYGALVNDVNNDGYTPLHFLLDGQNNIESTKKLTAIKYLLKHSAAVDVKNNNGKTAIDLAKDNFSEALIWLEHPETLPSINEIEASIIGLSADLTQITL